MCDYNTCFMERSISLAHSLMVQVRDFHERKCSGEAGSGCREVHWEGEGHHGQGWHSSSSSLSSASSSASLSATSSLQSSSSALSSSSLGPPYEFLGKAVNFDSSFKTSQSHSHHYFHKLLNLLLERLSFIASLRTSRGLQRTPEKVIKSTLLENPYYFWENHLKHSFRKSILLCCSISVTCLCKPSFVSVWFFPYLSFFLCLFDNRSVMSLSPLANIYVWFGGFKYLRNAI